MVKVGIVGIGFMGMVHYLSYQKTRGVKVTAICEQFEKRLKGDWRDIKGNFGPAGTRMDLTGVATYSNVDKILDDPNVEVVDICLPPSLHADIAIRAMKAGKDVFCEKPMALSIADCRRMDAASKKTGRQLMIGHVLPLFPEYAYACKVIESGKYGKLLGGHFKRVISDPAWLPDFYNPEKVGGPMLDLHVHDAHFIRLLFGQPKAVTSAGRMRGEVVEYFESVYSFEDPEIVVGATSGVVRQPGRGFTHGYEIHLEKAMLTFEFAVVDGEGVVLMPCTVLPQKGKAKQPKLGDGDPMCAFEQEIKTVVKSIKSGQAPPMLQSQLAQDAISLCHKQTDSVRKGRTVKVS